MFSANVHLHSKYFLPKGYLNAYNEAKINVGEHLDSFTGVSIALHSGEYHYWFDSRTKCSKLVIICIRINGVDDKYFE